MKALVDITYQCPVKGCSKWKSNEWTDPERARKVEELYCNLHKELAWPKGEVKPKIPMTDWQKEKLAMQRTDKAWRDHIEHRKNIKVNGKTHTVLTDDKGNIKREVPIPE